MAKKLQILYFFLLENGQGWQNEINIKRYSGHCGCFIFGIINYDKHCTAKVSVVDIDIVYRYLID